MDHKKINLVIELGATSETALKHLQLIKDAMTNAIFNKINCTGITDAQDEDFTIYQAIYLEAHHQATQLPLRP